MASPSEHRQCPVGKVVPNNGTGGPKLQSLPWLDAVAISGWLCCAELLRAHITTQSMAFLEWLMFDVSKRERLLDCSGTLRYLVHPGMHHKSPVFNLKFNSTLGWKQTLGLWQPLPKSTWGVGVREYLTRSGASLLGCVRLASYPLSS